MFELAEATMSGLLKEDMEQNRLLQQLLDKINEIDLRLDDMLERVEELEQKYLPNNGEDTLPIRAVWG